MSKLSINPSNSEYLNTPSNFCKLFVLKSANNSSISVESCPVDLEVLFESYLNNTSR